jgi:hypothetical protein
VSEHARVRLEGRERGKGESGNLGGKHGNGGGEQGERSVGMGSEYGLWEPDQDVLFPVLACIRKWSI